MSSTGACLATGSPSSSHCISVNTLKDFILRTNLETGSNNDGNRTLTKKGMVIGEKYYFAPQTTRDNKETFTWIIEYTSPATSSIKPSSRNQGYMSIDAATNSVKIKSNISGYTSVLDLGKENYLDMAGCHIKVTCYITNQPNNKITKQYFIHNRFRYFDGHSFNFQVNQRMANPLKIDQGHSSLCGMASLYYILIQRDKNLYQKIAKELHRTGVYYFSNGYTIEPNTSMYEIKSTDQDYKDMKMAEADWIVLASTRSGESYIRYNGIEKGAIDQLGGVNWMDMLTRMCKQVAGYSNVQSHDLGLVKTGFTLLTGMHSSVENLIELDKKYKSGKKILIMTDPKLIYDERGWRNPTSIHWVVYEGGLQLLDVHDKVLTTNIKETSKVTFKIYTWGEIRVLRKVPLLNFESNYYGYIEA